MYTIIAPLPTELATAIEPYRQRFDPTASLSPPHIAIVEPFQFTPPLEQLCTHLSEVGKAHTSIKVSVVGWHIPEDNNYQLLLPLIAGQAQLTALRQHILTSLLSCLARPIPYRPHILLGKFLNHTSLVAAKQNIQDFEPRFTFRVNQVELWQRNQAELPWQVVMAFALKATLTGYSQAAEEKES